MKRWVLVAVSFALLTIGLFLTSTSYADCIPIYGGGQSCTNPRLSLEKTVFNPVTSTYVHDLGINDTHFTPGEKVSFQITVTNNGDSRASHVTIADTLPPSLVAVAPSADSPATPQKITIPAGDLEANQSSTFVVVAEIASNIPAGVTCSSNKAEATFNTNTDPATDFSQFCFSTGETAPTNTLTEETPTPFETTPTITPEVTTTTLPPTGPDILSLAIPLSSGAVGLTLKILTRKST